MTLVEVDGCIFDADQLERSRGFESLDPVSSKAFVNHIHIAGNDRNVVADRIIASWVAEMRSRWPDRAFRIYRHSEPTEVIIRFHQVRPGVLNWCEDGIEIIAVGVQSVDSRGDTV
jgi:hypothetical protein